MVDRVIERLLEGKRGVLRSHDAAHPGARRRRHEPRALAQAGDAVAIAASGVPAALARADAEEAEPVAGVARAFAFVAVRCVVGGIGDVGAVGILAAVAVVTVDFFAAVVARARPCCPLIPA